MTFFCVTSWFLLYFFKARCSGRKGRQLGSSVIRSGEKGKVKGKRRERMIPIKQNNLRY